MSDGHTSFQDYCGQNISEDKNINMSIKIEIDIRKHIKSLWNKVSTISISHVLLLSLALHLFVMPIPQDGFIFDEAHYVPAALKNLQLQPANAEHPPLTKIIIALSIGIFGNYWFAWRIPIILFGLASLYMVYLVAKQFMTEKYALLSTAFLSFDTMFFVHASIAILDMPEVFFSLAAIYLFLKKKYYWSSLAFAVAFLCQERTLFFTAFLLIYILFSLPRFIKDKSRKTGSKLTRLAKVICVSTLIFLTIAFGGLYIYEVIYKPTKSATVTTIVNQNIVQDTNGNPITTITTTFNTTISNYITNPIDHIQFALQYYFNLAPAINPSPQDYRPPWSWTLPLVNTLNPPHYLTVATSTNGGPSKKIVDWVSQVSFPIAYMFYPMFILCIFNAIKKRERKFSLFFISWTSGTYLPWLIFGAFIQHMTFNYYFLSTTPILAMGVPYFWNSLPFNNITKKVGLIIHLTLTILCFIYYFPVVLIRT